MTSASTREAAAVLTAAFHADPVYGHLIPDGVRRRRALTALFTVAVRDASRFGAVDLAPAAGRITGAAVWLAPGRFPLSGRRKLRSTPWLVALAAAAPGSFIGVARLGAAVEAAQPRLRSWYLAAIGVQPDAQGQGVGASLLERGLARADRERAAATLETASPAAAELYARFGFRVTRADVQLVPGAPAHTFMVRPPDRDGLAA